MVSLERVKPKCGSCSLSRKGRHDLQTLGVESNLISNVCKVAQGGYRELNLIILMWTSFWIKNWVFVLTKAVSNRDICANTGTFHKILRRIVNFVPPSVLLGLNCRILRRKKWNMGDLSLFKPLDSVSDFLTIFIVPCFYWSNLYIEITSCPLKNFHVFFVIHGLVYLLPLKS